MFSNIISSPRNRDQAISELEHISGKMRITSMLIMLTTVVNIMLTLWITYGMSTLNLSRREIYELVHVAWFCTIFAIIVVLLFDFFKRKGDACFEELSDELHGSKVPNEDFSLSARIVMRSYSKYASLPLIPGQFGPGIMAGVNILLPFLILTFMTAVGFRS
uniref:Uncharacterized protein n=1 Tax=Candidatus Kentrum sp. MB TaxID=2138164 RepID=A0A451BFX3_9GAMM|nr:MAG: hypothetical protein BECKMB1821I_GA0114274_11049 [Candidatus Kentron sp. MB]VFK77194.1 MAG: hypothetical protein BECKMB1821H_GA0114242_11089 [Candidatus Kentron sp. MB]